MNHEDLMLQAYLYVHGELSAADCEAFELRMADDQSAREAVAQAVELTQAVASLPADVWRETPIAAQITDMARAAGINWRRRIVWIASGAVACALLIMAFAWPGGTPDNDQRALRDGKSTTNNVSGDLALEWVAAHAADEADAEADSLASEMTQDPLFHLAHMAHDLAASEDDSEIDWVQAAVAGLNMSGRDIPEAGPVMKE